MGGSKKKRIHQFLAECGVAEHTQAGGCPGGGGATHRAFPGSAAAASSGAAWVPTSRAGAPYFVTVDGILRSFIKTDAALELLEVKGWVSLMLLPLGSLIGG